MLSGDAKATFNLLPWLLVYLRLKFFNKVLAEITKHAFPVHAFCKQMKCLRRHLAKPRSMNLRSFINRLQELNAYLEDFLLDTEGQEIAPLPEDETMDIIYHSMPTT